MNFGDPRLPERFWAKCMPEPMSGCWLWFARRNRDGYGSVARRLPVPGRRKWSPYSAHRWAYQHLVGPSPDGLQLDHKCRVRCCVNPAHLEPVTQQENIRRGVHVFVTNCKHGHPFDEANTYRVRGRRQCRTCNRNRQAKHLAKKRAA